MVRVDELVLALRSEIKKANGDSDKIIEWQQKKRLIDMKKKPRNGVFLLIFYYIEAHVCVSPPKPFLQTKVVPQV